MKDSYQYDAAISYAGPDKDVAERLASELIKYDLNIFFDLFEKESVWGKPLYIFLTDIYENRAKYCIVLISKNYRDRIWTKHELHAAFNRAVYEKKEYILPIRLDQTEIDGLQKILHIYQLMIHRFQKLRKYFIIRLKLKRFLNLVDHIILQCFQFF